MKTTRMYALAILALAVAGCGHEPIERDVRELGEHVDALETAMDEHAARVDGSADMSTLPVEEHAHEVAVRSHMDRMHHEMGDMGMCGGDGEGRAMGSMIGLTEEAEEKCATHRASMMGAADMDAARVEEARHHEAMRRLIAGMREQMTAMIEDDDGHCSEDMH